MNITSTQFICGLVFSTTHWTVVPNMLRKFSCCCTVMTADWRHCRPRFWNKRKLRLYGHTVHHVHIRSKNEMWCISSWIQNSTASTKAQALLLSLLNRFSEQTVQATGTFFFSVLILCSKAKRQITCIAAKLILSDTPLPSRLMDFILLEKKEKPLLLRKQFVRYITGNTSLTGQKSRSTRAIERGPKIGCPKLVLQVPLIYCIQHFYRSLMT